MTFRLALPRTPPRIARVPQINTFLLIGNMFRVVIYESSVDMHGLAFVPQVLSEAEKLNNIGHLSIKQEVQGILGPGWALELDFRIDPG